MSADRVIHLDDIRDIPAAASPPTPEHSWRPLNLVDLAANPPEPPTIGGLLYPGKRTVLSGETESMKTWFALILAKAELDIGRPVVWVDLDAMGPGAMLQRLEKLGVARSTVADGFHYIEPNEQLDPPKRIDLTGLIASEGVRLCVIDAFNPILALHQLDPNVTSDIEKFWTNIADPICHAGAAPVLLDHVAKNPEARGKYAYGSERKASGAIVHLGFKLLEPLRQGGVGRSLLSVHKDRPGYLPRPALGRLILDDTDPAALTYRVEPDKSHDEPGRFRPTVLMQKVSTYLELHPGAATGKEIEESVTGNAKALRTAIQTLIEDGYVRAEKGVKNATLHTSLRPYREADEPTPFSSSSVRPQFVLTLESEQFVCSSSPLGGDEDALARPEDEHQLVQPLTTEPGDPIPEYDYQPPDDTLYDPDRNPDNWADL